MNIIDYLDAINDSHIGSGDNIQLLRPVVNVLIGDFFEDEINTFTETLGNRVGKSGRLHYSIICQPEKTCSSKATKIDYELPNDIGFYDVKRWNDVKTGFEESGLHKSIKIYVTKVFNDVSSFSYESKGYISLNFIIKLGWVGIASLEKIIKCFEEEFSKYFENGVISDLYCLIDQKAYPENEYGEERKAIYYRSLELIEKLIAERKKNPAFILSNWTSQSCFVGFSQSQLRTVALHIIIKDGKADRDDGENAVKKNIYENAAFLEEAKDKEFIRVFCTLGNMNLEVDKKLREQVVLKSVFSHLFEDGGDKIAENFDIATVGLNEDDIEKRLIGGKVRVASNKMLFPLLINKDYNPSRLLNVSCGDAVDELFGKSLDYFYNENLAFKDNNDYTDEYLFKQLENAVLKNDIYDSVTEIMHALILEKNFLQKKEEEYAEKYEQSKTAFERWKGSRYVYKGNLNEIEKESGTYKVFFSLACDYLNKKAEIEQSKEISDKAGKMFDKIVEKIDRSLEQINVFKRAEADLEEIIRAKEKEGYELICGNMEKHYSNRIDRWIGDNGKDFGFFVQKIKKYIGNVEINEKEVFAEVIKFCNDKILKSGDYTDDISKEMLERLKNYKYFYSEDSIYGLAFSTVMNHKVFYADQIDSGKIPYIACFLVNPDNGFVKSNISDMHALIQAQKIKWFFEKSFDGMDILFIEGSFRASDLYQYDFYKKVNEQYEKEI